MFPGPVEGPRRPKIAEYLRPDFFTTSEVWDGPSRTPSSAERRGGSRPGAMAPRASPPGAPGAASRGPGAGPPEAEAEGVLPRSIEDSRGILPPLPLPFSRRSWEPFSVT